MPMYFFLTNHYVEFIEWITLRSLFSAISVFNSSLTIQVGQMYPTINGNIYFLLILLSFKIYQNMENNIMW